MQKSYAPWYAGTLLGLMCCCLHAQSSTDPANPTGGNIGDVRSSPSAPVTRPTGTNVITLSNSNLTGSQSDPLFARLDVDRKGFLSPRDVASNQFLSDNFHACDTNGDGRLSPAETTACLKNSGQR